MERSEKFGLVLSPMERALLRRLAEHERLPAAAVVRRLIWREAEKLPGAIDATDDSPEKGRLEG